MSICFKIQGEYLLFFLFFYTIYVLGISWWLTKSPTLLIEKSFFFTILQNFNRSCTHLFELINISVVKSQTATSINRLSFQLDRVFILSGKTERCHWSTLPLHSPSDFQVTFMNKTWYGTPLYCFNQLIMSIVGNYYIEMKPFIYSVSVCVY